MNAKFGNRIHRVNGLRLSEPGRNVRRNKWNAILACIQTLSSRKKSLGRNGCFGMLLIHPTAPCERVRVPSVPRHRSCVPQCGPRHCQARDAQRRLRARRDMAPQAEACAPLLTFAGLESSLASNEAVHASCASSHVHVSRASDIANLMTFRFIAPSVISLIASGSV